MNDASVDRNSTDTNLMLREGEPSVTTIPRTFSMKSRTISWFPLSLTLLAMAPALSAMYPMMSSLQLSSSSIFSIPPEANMRNGSLYKKYR